MYVESSRFFMIFNCRKACKVDFMQETVTYDDNAKGDITVLGNACSVIMVVSAGKR